MLPLEGRPCATRAAERVDMAAVAACLALVCRAATCASRLRAGAHVYHHSVCIVLLVTVQVFCSTIMMCGTWLIDLLIAVSLDILHKNED